METVSGERVRRGWRSRWAAIGAAVAVSLGAGGGFLIAEAASGPESSVVMADPVRILDTRDPVNVGLPGPFVSPIAQKLQVTGPIPTSTGTQTVVPTGATGVLLNVTAVGASADGFISIRPGDATGAPATSSLNVTAGVTVPNAVQVALPTTGANAGKIDITWDALGVAGPTTDILIDVVGHTSNAKLDALQAEVDAVEAVNATQQTQIDAKANSADVYTKTEIDASTANTLRVAGGITNTGVVNASFAQVGMAYTPSKTGTGEYRVVIPGLQPGCSGGGFGPVVTATVWGAATVSLTGSGWGCPSGDTTLDFDIYDPVTGALTDAGFLFTVHHDWALPLGAALNGPDVVCTITPDTEPICE